MSAEAKNTNEAIERENDLLLVGEDYKFFLEILDDKILPKPSERTRVAATIYRRGIRNGERYYPADFPNRK